MFFTKNNVPIFISVAIYFVSYWLPAPFQEPVKAAGLFAFSGALTNWLAVYMLFEKVPFIYGSGVIPSRFESLKVALLDLVKTKLFKVEIVQRVFDEDKADGGININVDPLLESIQFELVFEQLKDSIMQSSFGSVLNMVGGESVLEPMRDKITERIKRFVKDTIEGDKFQKALQQGINDIAGSESFIQKIESIIQQRLDELTPEMVNDIMKDMIKKHLGWLVVWGAIFGGLLGIASVYLP